MYIYIRGDFFVQAFKIVVDSWKFTMLLLYILWDDRPIFMISSSKEHQQPDCYNWRNSKIQSDNLEERYTIKLCFKLGKKCHSNVWNASHCFGVSSMNRTSVFEWHKRFKEARESVRDDERCGRSKKVSTLELIGQRVRIRDTMLRF